MLLNGNKLVNGNQLNKEEIAELDPYQLMAVLGKKVIHPGGKQSTREFYAMADLQAHHSVLDIGCGVDTTCIDLVRKFGCNIIITDIDDKMIDKARKNVEVAGLIDKIKVEKADIQQLSFADNTFDVIIIEAVTMFVNRHAAIKEVLRVCKPTGRVIEQEFIWRKTPTVDARRILEGGVCPGIKFDSADDWITIYESNGFIKTQLVTGPFRMMSLAGFLKDEGMLNTLSIMAKAITRVAYMKKMAWLMPRIMKVKNSLGYIVFSVEKKT